MNYATKEELAEVKSMIEDIKAMIQKEEMSEEVSEEVQEEVKEELSAVEKVTHNPETEDKKINFLYGQSRPQNTMDRVMKKISQINK
jgi:ABC-type hemin transport system substrate-binding protein